MNITNYHFDALCDSLMEAAKEIGVDSETLDDVFLVLGVGPMGPRSLTFSVGKYAHRRKLVLAEARVNFYRQ